MPIFRLPRHHTRNFFARRFVDSAQSLGEQSILLKQYNVGNPNNDPRPKSEHWDEVYQQIDDYSVENDDYGNPFEGGIESAYRIWTIWTETSDAEQVRKRGEYTPEKREVQAEPWPDVYQNDYLIRIARWSANGTPLELHPFRYQIVSGVIDATVHTGGQLSQTDRDRWGQKFSVSALPQTHPIYGYEVDLTQPFPRHDSPPY